MSVITTRHGRLRGLALGPVTAWLGVPYAAPPVGDLRFRAPQPVTPWTGERDATRFGHAAPQLSPETPLAEAMVKKNGTSDDCLTLNVWAPAAAATDGRPRPVLMWIHGGAFMMGTGATYDGAELAALGDVVIVTINYRLGLFGFVALGALWDDPRFDANVGLLDVVAALRWVRDHVADFGGDPAQVTLAGESAGATAAELLLIAPATRGLFRAVISQSSAATLLATRERAVTLAGRYADALGITRATADQLFARPLPELMAVHQRVMLANLGTVTTRPYLDGGLLPADEAALRAAPTPAVPLLLGSNADEATLFVLLKMLPTERGPLAGALRRRLPDHAVAILDAYPDDRPGTMQLARDALFTMPMVHLADRHSAHSPTWMYRFDWPTPAFGGQLGAMHALELFLMWMDVDRRGVQLVLGGPPSPALRALAGRMKRRWLSFVRTLDPGDPEAPDDAWPRYDATTRATRVFHLEDRVALDPEAPRRQAWAGADALEA
jgi:para-nitrobenzyl esterase